MMTPLDYVREELVRKLGPNIMEEECWYGRVLGRNLVIVKYKLSRPVPPENGKILNVISDKLVYEAAVIGLPSGLELSPCRLAQAYLYSSLINTGELARIRNRNLRILAYALGARQLRDVIDSIAEICAIVVIISPPGLPLPTSSCEELTCDPEDLFDLSRMLRIF